MGAVLKELDRDPTSQSWMWGQASGPPDRKVVKYRCGCWTVIADM